ncbi:hypothetical protein RND71_040249 [Anisodus tanguticus]|uniref:Uncharacterized protein n=1 Tax=Anisodus tanguticus TaxID=243964 RepID=A0AAE1QV80_9SOLA|nr:hypothetical protein RND71_040249 [Anisodus tanguticus]
MGTENRKHCPVKHGKTISMKHASPQENRSTPKSNLGIKSQALYHHPPLSITSISTIIRSYSFLAVHHAMSRITHFGLVRVRAEWLPRVSVGDNLR